MIPRPLVHRVATWLVLAFCAWLAARGVMKGLRPGGNDFTTYYDSARALLEGRDPLLVRASIYPPSFAAALTPFALLPYAIALWLWQAASFAGLIAGWRRCLQMLGPELERRPWVPWLALLAVSRLADSTFAYGQVNTLTFWLVTEAVFRWRKGGVLAPALALGAGAALKVLPALFVFWLVVRRAWRPVFASLAAIALLALVPPLLLMGPQRAARSFEHWGELVLTPVASGGEELFEAREYVPGQSLTAVGYRLFSATPATSQGTRGPRANWLDLPLATTHRIVLALSALHVLLWAAVLLRRRSAFASAEPEFLLEAGLSIAMILVLGPVVQKAHMVWLLLPIAALLGIPSRLSGWRRGLREGLLAASILLVGFTAPAILGDAAATRLVSGNIVFLALEACLAALVLELWLPRPAGSNP